MNWFLAESNSIASNTNVRRWRDKVSATEKEYLEGIYDATIGAIGIAQGEITKLRGISRSPFPELASKMNDRLDALNQDARHLRLELDKLA